MTDFLLVMWVSALIEMRRFGWMFGLGKRWTPGEKLKLLFAGYNGTRNTGSDVRVQEMLRQIRHVLGAENVDFSVMTQNFDRTKGYFEGSKQVHLPDVFPPFLNREVYGNHGVISCADDHDDWVIGIGVGGEQVVGGVWRRRRAYG